MFHCQVQPTAIEARAKPICFTGGPLFIYLFVWDGVGKSITHLLIGIHSFQINH